MGVNGVGLLFSGCLIGCAGGKGGDGLAAGMVYSEAPDAPPFQSRIKIVAERVSAVLRSAIVVVAVVAHPVAHADAGFGQQPRLFAEICPQSAAVGFGQAAQTVGRLVERAIKADEPVLRVKFGLGVVAAGAQAGGGLDKAGVQRCAAGGLGVEAERRQRIPAACVRAIRVSGCLIIPNLWRTAYGGSRHGGCGLRLRNPPPC